MILILFPGCFVLRVHFQILDFFLFTLVPLLKPRIIITLLSKAHVSLWSLLKLSLSLQIGQPEVSPGCRRLSLPMDRDYLAMVPSTLPNQTLALELMYADSR